MEEGFHLSFRGHQSQIMRADCCCYAEWEAIARCHLQSRRLRLAGSGRFHPGSEWLGLRSPSHLWKQVAAWCHRQRSRSIVGLALSADLSVLFRIWLHFAYIWPLLPLQWARSGFWLLMAVLTFPGIWTSLDTSACQFLVARSLDHLWIGSRRLALWIFSQVAHRCCQSWRCWVSFISQSCFRPYPSDLRFAAGFALITEDHIFELSPWPFSRRPTYHQSRIRRGHRCICACCRSFWRPVIHHHMKSAVADVSCRGHIGSYHNPSQAWRDSSLVMAHPHQEHSPSESHQPLCPGWLPRGLSLRCSCLLTWSRLMLAPLSASHTIQLRLLHHSSRSQWFDYHTQMMNRISWLVMKSSDFLMIYYNRQSWIPYFELMWAPDFDFVY